MPRFSFLLCLVLLFFITTVTHAAHPECTYLCDSPVCSAVCEVQCQPPQCEVVCDVGGVEAGAALCATPMCVTQCLTDDVSESDSCPVCQMLCEHPSCLPQAGLCETRCQPPSCGWHCSKPTNCPAPTCQLQCERPACEAPIPGDPPTNSCLATTASVLYEVNCYPTRTCNIALATGMSTACLAPAV